ncbi:MAG: pilus assembly protein FimV, partial [Colwellia sp.]
VNDSVNDSANNPENDSTVSSSPAVEDKAEAAEVTDPDDIDALLDSVNNSANGLENDWENNPENDSTASSSPVVEDKAEAEEVTDPDDIDALLDSVNNSANGSINDSENNPENDSTASSSPVVEDKAEAIEVTDPDDIDALLDSVSGQTSVIEEPLDEKVEDVDVTDPDDIDALLESMSGNVPAIQQGVKQDFTEAMSQPNSDMGMDEASDIYKAKEKDSTLSAEEQSLQDEIAENEAKIAEFTAEYVTPFLTADFSGIMSKESDAELEPETREIDGLGDDLDIDALIADSFSKDEVSENIQQDEIEDNEADELGDDLDAKQLLTDSLEGSVEQPEDTLLDAIVLSPDFNDEDILAELLAETAESDDKKLNNTDELEVIEELNDVDFDELLANIGEELASITDDEVGLTLDEIGDDLVGNNLIDDKIQRIEKLEPTEDYVSVDDLLSESLEQVDEVEPYEKTNIDVGLGQFSQNESGVDVDENSSMTSQLDLAKMYIEMNDEENAQVILQEIISTGDVIHKVEAQELLDSL